MTQSLVLQIVTLEAQSIAKKRNSFNKTNLVALPPLPKLSIYVKFQRNQLPNVEEIKLFNVRPPPKYCLMNLLMSSSVIARSSVTYGLNSNSFRNNRYGKRVCSLQKKLLKDSFPFLFHPFTKKWKEFKTT